MDRPDLNAAKEVANRENWDNRLPDYDKEMEEEYPKDSSPEAGVSGLDNLHLGDDPWDNLGGTQQDELSDDLEGDISTDGGDSSQRQDMGSLEDIYSRAGEAELAKQDGQLTNRIKMALSSVSGDIVEVNDRTTHVNLSFLESNSDRRRVAGIIERIIKIHSAIPGALQMSTTGKKGMFAYHVTNDYLSPTRDLSPVTKVMPPPVKIPKVEPAKPTPSKLPELINGIVLSPTYPGLPKCVLKYGSLGLTPELVGKVQQEYPEKSLNDVLNYCLKQTGKGQRIANLYNIPM